MTSLVLITSCLKVSDKPLNYISSRSVYSEEERYIQTLESISSVRRNIPDCKVVLLETNNNSKYLQIIQDKVDEVYVLKNEDMRESLYKGFTELTVIYEYLKLLNDKGELKYKHYYKLSGRYNLYEEFKLDKWCQLDTKYTFAVYPQHGYYSTVFYRFDAEDFLEVLHSILLENNIYMSIEYIVYRKIRGIKSVHELDKTKGNYGLKGLVSVTIGEVAII
jgi:hypothetical protein